MPDDDERIIVLTEEKDDQATPLTWELLGLGRELADAKKALLCVCVMGGNVTHRADTYACYADRVYVIENRRLGDFQADLYADLWRHSVWPSNPVRSSWAIHMKTLRWLQR